MLSTINRTLASFLLAKVAAEYLLGLLSHGTHSWQQFITPNELSEILKLNHLTPVLVQGTGYNPVTRTWYYQTDTSVNYCMYAIKT